MKKLFNLFVCLLAAVCVLAACDNGNDTPVEQNPTISGAVDKTINKGEKFVPLAGVTASDPQDGDLTSAISVKTNVNYNQVGTYTVTYTVYDNDGNKAEVTITVNVVLNDQEAPMISGVNKKEIIVGEAFNPMSGVYSNDVIDGDLTSDIEITGEVNIWVPGTYTLTYVSTDASGNETEATREVVVSLGYFEFDENILPSDAALVDGTYTAKVSSGALDTSLSAFGLAELTFKAVATEATTATISLVGATSQETIEIAAGEHEYVAYFNFEGELTDADFTIATAATVSELSLKIGSAKDRIAPVISVPENLKVVLPGNVSDASILAPFIINKLEAVDNIDGIVNSGLTVDFSSVDLGNYTGEAEVIAKVEDSAGNVGEATIAVEFTGVYNSKILPNEDFSSSDLTPFELHDTILEPTLEIINGQLVHENHKYTGGDYDSISCPKASFAEGTFKAGNYYMLKFDAKATKDRRMTVRLGLNTSAELGWIENFEGTSNYPLSLTTEMKTYYVIFYVHSEVSQSGHKSFNFELKLGHVDGDYNTSKYVNNPVYFDNMQFYLLSNENTAPEITPVKGLPTTFGKNATLPSFADYVVAYDLEDGGVLTLTDANIDLSKVDVTKAGTYPVTITVKDSGDKETSYTFEIVILDEADTEAPVITVENDNITIKQDKAATILSVIKASVVDNIDGEIALTAANISGEYNLGVVGTYTLTITVKDTSGNEATKDVTINVTDGEAPVIEVANKIDYCINDAIDFAKLIKITDNVDGNIAFDPAFISGTYDLTQVGTYEITIKVKDAANNEAEVVVTLEVYPEMGENYVVEDFEGYATTDDLNVEDGDLYRRWLPYGGEPQTLNDLELIEADGNKAVQFRYNSGGESILVKNFTEKLPSKYQYLRFKIETQAEKLRVWAYTASGNKATALYPFRDLNYDEEGYYYLPISATGANIGDLTGIGISMNYQQAGDSAIVDEIGFSVSCPETIKSDFDPIPEDPNAVQISNATTDNSKYSFSSDYKVVTVVTMPTNAYANWFRWNFANLSADVKKVTLTVKTVEGYRLAAKVDGDGNPYDSKAGNKQIQETVDGELVFEWDLVALGIDASKILKIVLWANDTDQSVTTTDIELVSIVTSTEAEVVPDGSLVQITNATTDNSKYSFSSDYKVVTVVTMPTNAYANWFRWNFANLSADVKKVTLTVKTVEGYRLAAKVDGDGNPYDSKAGNKQIQDTVNGELVFEWDLVSLGIDASKILKIVLWANDTDQSVTTTDIELVSITTSNEVEEVVELPEAVIGVTSGNANIMTFSEDKTTLIISALPLQSSYQWARWDIKGPETAQKLVKVILKADSEVVVCVRFDDANNSYNVEAKKQYKKIAAGEELELVFDLEALEIDATKLAKFIVMPYNSDRTGEACEITLLSMEFVPVEQGGSEEPDKPEVEVVTEEVTISGATAGNAIYTFSEDKKVVTVSAIPSSMSQWARWDFPALEAGVKKITLTVKTTEGYGFAAKVDGDGNPYDGVSGNKQYKGTVNGELVITWDLEALGIDSSKLIKVVFWAYDSDQSVISASVELVSIKYEVEKEVVEEPTSKEVTISGATAGNAIYLFSEDKKVVTISAIPSSMSQWARWDFPALEAGVKKITLTVKTTEGYGFAAKVDGDGNPYDGVSGNKQYKGTVNGELVITWDLETLGIDSSKLKKVVFWAYDSDQSVTSASVELVSIVVE